MKELSHDLVVKEAQIEYLISVLPGIGNSEQRQVERLKELEAELAVAEKERAEAGMVLEEVKERLDGVVGLVRR
jgi:mediator of RNA polymerase II transcription subunit 21